MVEEAGGGLVFWRLAILDPASRADQLMADPSGRATLVFNGEIYNYRALRRDLEAEGMALRTTGDTEAILLGYLAWGEALLDRWENRLLAARDPFGIKPLYMLRHGALTAFASEARPLARLPAPEPDPDALAELLTFGWAAGAYPTSATSSGCRPARC